MNAEFLRRLLTGMNPEQIRSQMEKQRAEIRELEEEKKRQLNKYTRCNQICRIYAGDSIPFSSRAARRVLHEKDSTHPLPMPT